MRLVLSCQAIKRVLEPHEDTLLRRQVNASPRAVTDEILKCYKDTLGPVYEPWFANEMHCNGFRYIKTNELISIPKNPILGDKNCYVSAAFIWGKVIIGNSLKQNEIEAISNYGIKSLDMTNDERLPVGYGDNPIFEWILHCGDTFDSQNLKEIFKQHRNIHVMDKFFFTKIAAQNMLQELLKSAPTVCKVTILGTDGSIPAAMSTRNRLRSAFPACNISTIVSNLDSRLHDRHIILDNKIQISITAGLDMFEDTHGNRWTASTDSKISVYSLLDYSSRVQLSGRNHSGLSQNVSVNLARKI